jgi:hypothetical protein
MSAMSPEIIKGGFYQKKLFLQWTADNPDMFTHQPYLLRQGKGIFVVGFRGVSKRIACYFFATGSIEIRIYDGKKFFDIIREFDLFEERTKEGRWLCSMCRDHPNLGKTEPLIEYSDRKKLWIEHSFAPLAAWTRESCTKDAMLCLYHSGGATWAAIEQGAHLKKAEDSRYLFKKFSILTVR